MNFRQSLATTGWGVFAACSWTWGIAMYLPLILLPELGVGAVLVFAVPNIVGAAAFGYVVSDPQRRRMLLDRHRTAARWFSLVTVAYHVYFVGLLTVSLTSPPNPWVGAAVGAALIGAAFLLSAAPTRAWPWLAGLTYAGSLATFAALPLPTFEASGSASAIDLGSLALVMCFGFALCPYFDLTFYRTMDESPSRHAFAIFGLAFSVMIVLTCAYRDRLGTLMMVPFGHIAAQTVFTCAAHLRELRRDEKQKTQDTRQKTKLVLALAVLLAAAVLAYPAASSPETGERIYLRFLLFYALIVPAYGLLFMGPGSVLRPTRRNLVILAVFVLVAAPFYELAFIGRQLWLVMVPLAGLVAWKLIRR